MTGAYDNPYKFNAKELDAETGFYYYGARYYNPKWSQWYGVDPLAEKMPSWSPYVYTFDNPVNFVDPDGREPIGPGDPRSVQVYGYTVVRSASGWSVHRNSQMDKSITRIEGKNWTGAEESHFTVFNGSTKTTYENYESFSKTYPKHKLEGMPSREIAKLSWNATKAVAKAAATNPESQAVLLMPVFAVGEIFLAGEVASSSGVGRSIILNRTSGASRALIEGEPHSLYTYLSSDGKTAVSNFVYDANGKAVLEVNFKQHTKTALSGHGHTLKGSLSHANHIEHSNVPSIYKSIPKNTKPSQPLAK